MFVHILSIQNIVSFKCNNKRTNYEVRMWY